MRDLLMAAAMLTGPAAALDVWHAAHAAPAPPWTLTASFSLVPGYPPPAARAYPDRATCEQIGRAFQDAALAANPAGTLCRPQDMPPVARVDNRSTQQRLDDAHRAARQQLPFTCTPGAAP